MGVSWTLIYKLDQEYSRPEPPPINLSRSLTETIEVMFGPHLYGAETWPVKTSMTNKTGVFEMWKFHRIFKIPWTSYRYRTSNEEVLRRENKECELYLHHLLRTINIAMLYSLLNEKSRENEEWEGKNIIDKEFWTTHGNHRRQTSVWQCNCQASLMETAE